MTKEIATKKNETAMTMSDQVGSKEILASDVLIPRLLLMQGMSDFVKERKAQLGDIIRSTTMEVVGGPGKDFEFIPLAPPKTEFVFEQKTGARFEYRFKIPRTPKNEDLPWSYYGDKTGQEVSPGTNGATEWRRVKLLSLYVLLPADIDAETAEHLKAEKGEMPDLSKALTPAMIAFRSTSYNAGKDIVTFFTQAMTFKTQAWKYSLKASCVMETNDQGSYYVWKIDRVKPKPVLADHLEKVRYWAELVGTRADSLKTHEVDEA